MYPQGVKRWFLTDLVFMDWVRWRASTGSAFLDGVSSGFVWIWGCEVVDFFVGEDGEGAGDGGDEEFALGNGALNGDGAGSEMDDPGPGHYLSLPGWPMITNLEVLGHEAGFSEGGEGGSSTGRIGQGEGDTAVSDAEGVEKVLADIQGGRTFAITEFGVVDADQTGKRASMGLLTFVEGAEGRKGY